MPKIEHRSANRTVICVWHDLKFIKHINVQQLKKNAKNAFNHQLLYGCNSHAKNGQFR